HGQNAPRIWPVIMSFSKVPKAIIGVSSNNKYITLYLYRDGRVAVAHIFHQTQDYARLVLAGGQAG
ncbi:MAG: hypothetical protein RR204_06440, partial [Raoultibacter sp.]